MSELEQPVVEEEAAPVAEETPVAEVPADEEAQLDATIAEQTIDLPEGEKLVPLSAVTTVREKLKETKSQLRQATEGSARAQQLEQRIDELSQQLAQIGPKAQAYDAALLAQQQRPRTEDPADLAELEEIARDLDLYDAQGKPNIERARRIQAREQKAAQKAAQAAVGPVANHITVTQSNHMLARAKATVAPNGRKPDPKTLEAVWARLDPRLTATADGAKQAYAVAMGYTSLTEEQAATAPVTPRTATGQFTKQEIPAPLYTEKAGGKESSAMALNKAEQEYIKREGITEAEYLKSQPAWMKR